VNLSNNTLAIDFGVFTEDLRFLPTF